MACGRCGKRRNASNNIEATDVNKVLFGNYKYLSAGQIKARLEKYKRIHCSECEKRYICDYNNFLNCKKRG